MAGRLRVVTRYNSTLRGGYVTHHEYIQVGKGRDVGMNQISLFEAKVANGNGDQTLSRDVYRLGHHFDFYRMLSFYFTRVGFCFSSKVTVLIVYVFLYERMYTVLSGLEQRIIEDATISINKGLEESLATQSVFQLGLLLVLPMISLFEAKVANGNGDQTLSRDVYRLGHRFDFYRMLSFYFTRFGFCFSSKVTVLIVYVFLYERIYTVLSGLEQRIIEDATISINKGLEESLATQSVFQLGLLLVLPMVMMKTDEFLWSALDTYFADNMEYMLWN
ncbi:hypothetical protein CTI12_AA147550 [Artemisia annua]|uniref:Glycosyl transferase 48 domain-containing protein n=1 Tax=Artemisia annua TaxID=35608 RepID=A0A2U1PJ60_ARTAN|nr:hypothetical protein CTI12_AA147550 [Artemisia annua]